MDCVAWIQLKINSKFLIIRLHPRYQSLFSSHSPWVRWRGQEGPDEPMTWLRTSSWLPRSWRPSCSLYFYSRLSPASKEESVRKDWLNKQPVKWGLLKDPFFSKQGFLSYTVCYYIRSILCFISGLKWSCTYSPQADFLFKFLLSLKYNMDVELKEKKRQIIIRLRGTTLKTELFRCDLTDCSIPHRGAVCIHET